MLNIKKSRLFRVSVDWKKIKAPKVAITYTDMDTKISRTKTITEVLESSSYTDLIDDGIKLQAKELIKYLKATGQK